MKINGTLVKDADEKLTVTITKSDVRTGTLKEAKSCAAANALCRQEGAEAALVHFTRAYIKKGKLWRRYSVPDALRSEIIAFDRGGEFRPGEYTLSPVQPTVRLDAPRKKYEYQKKEISSPRNAPTEGQACKAPLSRRLRRPQTHDGRLGIVMTRDTRDRRTCFDTWKRTDDLGRTVLDCHICGGVILPAHDRWEAEHVVPNAWDGKDIRPAHYSPCHKTKTKTDITAIAKGKRIRDRTFGIKRSKGFPKPKGAKFDWSKGRYVREEIES